MDLERLSYNEKHNERKAFLYYNHKEILPQK